MGRISAWKGLISLVQEFSTPRNLYLVRKEHRKIVCKSTSICRSAMCVCIVQVSFVCLWIGHHELISRLMFIISL